MKKSTLICLLSIISFAIHAQIKFRVGKSTDNTFTKGESAKLQYTQPSSETSLNSWLIQGCIDGGYTFKLSKRDKLSITVNGELQRNTLIEKKQDVRQAGLSADNKLEWLDGNDIAIRMLATTLSIKHSNDRVKDKESMQYILGSTYYAAANGAKANWAGKLFTPDLYCPLFGKSLGLVFDHNVGGVVMNEQSMYLSMVQANAGVNVYLLPEVFTKYLSNPRTVFIYANWNGRHAFQDEVDNDMQSLKKMGVGLDFSLLSLASALNKEAKDIDNRIMIKYEWVSGADPLKGLANQNYRQLTRNLVLNI